MIRPLLALALLAGGLSAQNLIRNGSFERNGLAPGCNINLTNQEFSAVVTCTGFGPAEEIDVMNGTGCVPGELPAPSGMTKVAIACQFPIPPGKVDAFSFKLSALVVAGGAYRFSFMTHAVLTGFSPEVGSVLIGLSSSPTDFGTLIGTFTSDPTEWKRLWLDFVAPVGASHLTVQHGSMVDAWTHVDDFKLAPLFAADAAAPPPDLPLAPERRDPAQPATLPDPDAAAPSALAPGRARAQRT